MIYNINIFEEDMRLPSDNDVSSLNTYAHAHKLSKIILHQCA